MAFWIIACSILAANPVAANPVAADTWPGFRGDGSGVTPAKNLPIRWTPDGGIAWKAAVRGYGQSAPVVWKDRVFVTSVDGPNQEQGYLQAYRLADGQLLWTREFAATQPLKNMFRNSRAAPTCVADAEGVYALFASGELVGLTHAGETRWERSLVKDYGEFQNGRGLSSSLAQTGDAVIALVDHEGPSYAVAVNKQTGDNRWKSDRGTRQASWSSPLVAYPFGNPVVILSSCETVEALDGETGRRLWTLRGLVGNRIPSASFSADRIFVGACEAEHIPMDPRDVSRSNCCLKLKQIGAWASVDTVWTSRKAVSYYSTPLAYQGCVYYVNKVGLLFCLDQQTGEEHYVERIGGPCWGSAIGGGGHVYLFLKKGEVAVIKAGPEFELVASNQVWTEDDEPVAAEPPGAESPSAGPQPPFPSGLPILPPRGGPPDLDSMDEGLLRRMFAYGDPILYGAAAVEGTLLLRTGETLICVRSKNAP